MYACTDYDLLIMYKCVKFCEINIHSFIEGLRKRGLLHFLVLLQALCYARCHLVRQGGQRVASEMESPDIPDFPLLQWMVLPKKIAQCTIRLPRSESDGCWTYFLTS